MARPRVFVSSTCYDLKHIRSSLDGFIKSLGFDSVLSEKGDIAFAPEKALDQSCYDSVSESDIFVLIIGGRYGSAASDEERSPDGTAIRPFDSVTKNEYKTAGDCNIPIYILIEASVYTEYRTFLRNKDHGDIEYEYADRDVFVLIEGILSEHRNNPCQPFERFADIETWLREQWAGRFRDLLKKAKDSPPIKSLADQIESLKEVNETLRIYLESVVEKMLPDTGKELVEKENKRLSITDQMRAIKDSVVYRTFAPSSFGSGRHAAIMEREFLKRFWDILLLASSFSDFFDRCVTQRIGSGKPIPELMKRNQQDIVKHYRLNLHVQRELNELRKIVERDPLPPEPPSGGPFVM